MKAVLEFVLPEEESEYTSSVNGIKFQSVLQDFDNMLRADIKYNNNISKEVLEKVEFIRAELHKLCLERNVSVWD
jgi:hypothetical protein